MCGIVGSLTPQRVNSEPILRALDSIRHRGPDSHGVFQTEEVSLGIRRLSIVDTTGGDQPIFNEDRSVVVVLNGEIYNYVELMADLKRSGHVFKSASDTEVLVHLYEEVGLSMT